MTPLQRDIDQLITIEARLHRPLPAQQIQQMFGRQRAKAMLQALNRPYRIKEK